MTNWPDLTAYKLRWGLIKSQQRCHTPHLTTILVIKLRYCMTPTAPSQWTNTQIPLIEICIWIIRQLVITKIVIGDFHIWLLARNSRECLNRDMICRHCKSFIMSIKVSILTTSPPKSVPYQNQTTVEAPPTKIDTKPLWNTYKNNLSNQIINWAWWHHQSIRKLGLKVSNHLWI